MKRILTILLAAVLLLSLVSCGDEPAPEDNTLTIAATTYPVYLFTTAITNGVDGVEVKLIINEQVSCLHDYTLTVKDMKIIEQADIIVMNGAGLEDFMADALAASDAEIIDASYGCIGLMEAHGHEGHDHDTLYDAHIWLTPTNALTMLSIISSRMCALNADNTKQYETNFNSASAKLSELEARCSEFSTLPTRNLITFHDGFRYFAEACGLTLLKSIEEEEGSEASAAEMKEIIALIEEYDIPAIFTEVNGSDATAQAIARETGVEVYQLNMIMSGEGSGIQPYLDAMNANYDTILRALGGE